MEQFSQRDVPHFDARRRWSGTTCTVDVTGDLDLAVAGDLAALVQEALRARPETLVIDLSGASFIDSSGLHELLRAHHESVERAIRLVIIPAPERAQRIFELCGLDTVLPFVATTALAAGC